ncbi:MAG: hypothetical protein QMC95_14880 [Desulfitobacteriaceae bacterium]|nr:hypothetical protein [Desulfitobacteriaceae bacterium]MDI6915478.1 hypothetical protein [Desulfitobacteriaceae bacterium]
MKKRLIGFVVLMLMVSLSTTSVAYGAGNKPTGNPELQGIQEQGNQGKDSTGLGKEKQQEMKELQRQKKELLNRLKEQRNRVQTLQHQLNEKVKQVHQGFRNLPTDARKDVLPQIAKDIKVLREDVNTARKHTGGLKEGMKGSKEKGVGALTALSTVQERLSGMESSLQQAIRGADVLIVKINAAAKTSGSTPSSTAEKQ